MNRKLPRFLAVPLVFPLIFSSFFCCCLPQTVHAAEANDQLSSALAAEEHPHGNHCDSHDPAQRSTTSHHECECPKLQGILAQSPDVARAADTAVYFLNYEIGFGPISLALVPESHKLLTEHSPPQFSSSSIPLYIKNPTLRI